MSSMLTSDPLPVILRVSNKSEVMEMANGIQVKFSSDLGTFVITHGNNLELLKVRTESELLQHGGIVGQNTRTLITQLRGKPDVNVFCRLEG